MTVTYRYRAATLSGEVVEGVVQAENPRAAIDELRRQTLVPVAVEPMHTRGANWPTLWTRWRSRGNRDDALAVGTRTIAAMLSGGATLDRALPLPPRTRATPTWARHWPTFAARCDRAGPSPRRCASGRQFSAGWRPQ